LRGHLPVLVTLASIHLFVLAPCRAQSADNLSSPDAERVPPDTSATAASPSSTPLALQALSANALSVWGGGSFATSTLLGNIQQAQLGLLGLRYERLLLPRPPHNSTTLSGPTLTYTVDVLPVVRLSTSSTAIDPTPPDSPPALREQDVETYGAGLSPAGLRLTFRPAKRVQPFLASSTGLLYFGERVPSERGKQFNFMFDVGAGVRVVLTPDFRLSAGYRYYHLSNGFRGQTNPGVDANLLHFGISFSR